MFVFTKIVNHLQRKYLSVNIFIVLTMMVGPVSARSGPSALRNDLITINVSNVSLNQVLTMLKEQSAYVFFYDKEAAKKIIVKDLNVAQVSLQEVLKKMRKELPLDYRVDRNEITIRLESEEEFGRRTRRITPGKIIGKISDEKGITIPGVTLKVTELGIGTQTGVDGTYFLNVAPGTYTLEISCIAFKTQRITGVVVLEGKVTTLDIGMQASKNTLSEVVITSSYRKASIEGLYAGQKNNSAVSDGITADQISRTPANNTAQVLAKISGIQLSNDRNVVIRGLSDRYNNVLLNGVMLPSSEPNKRDFAFDMIPSALLDNIVINKTATPDLTGEFTGGLVQINMKEIPTEDFFELTLGTGYNTQATGKNILGLDHGNKAWLGLESDIHAEPGSLTFGQYNVVIGAVANLNPTAEQRSQLNVFLGALPNNWQMKRYTGQPVQNYQIQAGKVFWFKNDTRLGIVGAVTYRNEQRADEKDIYNGNGFDYSGEQYKYTTNLGGSLNAGYSFGKNKFTLQNTYNRKFSDDLWKYQGIDFDNSNTRNDNYNNVTVANVLLQSQLGGEHGIGKRGIKADWNVSAARMDRDQPYSKVMTRLSSVPIDDYFGYDLASPTLRHGSLFYSGLKERLYNWNTDLQVPFRMLGLDQLFKTGYQGKYRTADFGSSLYRMLSFSLNGYAGVPYYDVYSRDNFLKDLYLLPVSGSNMPLTSNPSVDGYTGFQRLNAFYGMFDLKPLDKLRLIGGLRAEKNDQSVFDQIYNSATKTVTRKQTAIDQTDWLPSLNAIYSLTNKVNLRGALYKTVARPDLRELSSFQYFDYDLFDVIAGSSLNTTKIDNADLRLEYYPAPGEVISISGFYKKFKDPIEIVYQATSSGQQLFYTNLSSARDLGLELDLRKSLGFFSSSSLFLKDLFISGNLTLLNANIDFTANTAVDEKGNPVETKRNRPLTGQSPYIINGGLLYTGKKMGFNITYNRYGKRIVYASPNRASDQYENSRDMVDMQLSYKFMKQRKAEVRLNASNLLNQSQQFYINGFDPRNDALGFKGSSIEPYPGSTITVPENQLDPKGTSYNKDYDTIVRRNKFGTTYTLNLIYRF